jgi:hypothetical protein
MTHDYDIQNQLHTLCTLKHNYLNVESLCLKTLPIGQLMQKFLIVLLRTKFNSGSDSTKMKEFLILFKKNITKVTLKLNYQDFKSPCLKSQPKGPELYKSYY